MIFLHSRTTDISICIWYIFIWPQKALKYINEKGLNVNTDNIYQYQDITKQIFYHQIIFAVQADDYFKMIKLILKVEIIFRPIGTKFSSHLQIDFQAHEYLKIIILILELEIIFSLMEKKFSSYLWMNFDVQADKYLRTIKLILEVEIIFCPIEMKFSYYLHFLQDALQQINENTNNKYLDNISKYINIDIALTYQVLPDNSESWNECKQIIEACNNPSNQVDCNKDEPYKQVFCNKDDIESLKCRNEPQSSNQDLNNNYVEVYDLFYHIMDPEELHKIVEVCSTLSTDDAFSTNGLSNEDSFIFRNVNEEDELLIIDQVHLNAAEVILSELVNIGYATASAYDEYISFLVTEPSTCIFFFFVDSIGSVVIEASSVTI